MKTIKKYTAYFLVMILCFSLISPLFQIKAADPTIYLSTPQELMEFSRNCTLDNWSKNKQVVLKNDIDLTGVAFTPIPIFSGTFDGSGYTIRGLNLQEKGSHQGLFRYIEEGALIQNLNVEGNISPTGSKTYIGGITGINRGTLKNCTFSGTVNGDKYIGGLVGVNEAPGIILECSVSGIVYGESYIGGLAGENIGTLLQCSNFANVNTQVIQPDMDIESILSEELISLDHSLAPTSNISSDIMDIGGI